ncbi:MAG: peptidase T [Bacteroidales bacterium]|nr:peptidase T [Bacteroidales bacterium]
MKNLLLQRFSKYISYATTSDENSTSYPSTQALMDFADVMVEELKSIGMQDVAKDEYGYVTALLPANTDTKQPTIGFIAHLDTAPDMPGISAPVIIPNYDGKDIMLDAETNTALTLADFPELADYQGQTMLVTDGKHLLGADDKAGVAEIVCAMDYLIQHPEIKHGPLKVAFTPDEEIGQGVKYFDTAKFGCDFAYTMDGGAIGELEYENFNAAGATIRIQGRNIHPGYAKNKMVNAQLIAMELNAMLPEAERPQYTQDYEGFFLLTRIDGTVEECKMSYIIRDHDRAKFEEKKNLMQQIVDFLNQKYGQRISCEIKDQYYNMREKVEPVFYVVERAIKAITDAGVKPLVQPIRGGTDGANLSFRNLPCPNIFAGGHNFHGKYEYVPLESMVKATEVILNIAKEQ